MVTITQLKYFYEWENLYLLAKNRSLIFKKAGLWDQAWRYAYVMDYCLARRERIIKNIK